MMCYRQKFSAILLVFLLSLSLGAVAYADDNEFTEAEILHIAKITNQFEVEFAELALQRTDNDEVHQVANMMIRDHNEIIEELEELIGDMEETPRESEFSEELENQAREVISELGNAVGPQFDEIYITNEVEYHQQLLDLINEELLAETDDRELSAFLTNMTSELNAHLTFIQRMKPQILDDED